MLKNIVTILFLPISFAMLISCGLGDLTLITQFNKIETLVIGNRVLFHKEYIGDVEKISKTEDGHYLVELNIDSNYKKKLTVYSIFYIDNDPDNPSQKAVFTEQSKPGGILLTDNSVAVGLDHPPYLRHMLDDFNRKAEKLASEFAEKIGLAKESYKEQSTELIRQLEEGLAEIDRKLRELEKSMKAAPESETAKELRMDLNRLIYDLENTLGEVAAAIGQDLYESFHNSLDNLKNRLDELNRQNQPSFQQAGEKGESNINI